MPLSDFDFEILFDGSYTGTIQDEGSSAQVRYLIPWADLRGFIAALKGGWKKLNDLNWTYVEPERHPLWENLFAQTVAYENKGAVTVTGAQGARIVTWEHAIVTATFTALPTEDSSGGANEVVSEELDFYADVLTIPAGGVQSSTALVTDQSTTRIVPGCNYIITIYHVPELPGGDTTLIFGKLGKVNSKTFRGAEKDHMLFMGARASRSLASYSAFDTLRHWKVEYRFNYRPVSWNQIYFPGGVLDDATLVDSGDPLYGSADLNELLPSRLGGGINPNP